MATRVALYSRVSTAHQTTENQRLELERVAALRGWTIVANFTDEAVSGSKGRKDRPALDAMLKGATRRQFDLIAVWSCIDPPVSAQVRPLKHTPWRGFSSRGPDGADGGYKNGSSRRSPSRRAVGFRSGAGEGIALSTSG